MSQPHTLFARPLLKTTQDWAACSLAPVDSPETLLAAFDFAPQLAKLLPLSPAWLSAPGFIQQLVDKADDHHLFLVTLAESQNAETAERLAALHHQRLRFATRCTGPLSELPPPGDFSHISAIACSAAVARATDPKVLAQIQARGLHLIVDQVLSEDDFLWCASQHAWWIGAEFIGRPAELHPSEADPSKLKLLKLLSLVVQDADTTALENVFKQEPKLSYNLMRLVNSVSVTGGKTHVSNFGQAITLLGRRQLQRWLQLLIYANQFGSNDPNPLMLQAALRARLIEDLSHQLPELASFEDSGYMTGIFSLLDIQLGLPMADIVAALPLVEPVKEALTTRRGALGELLSLVYAIEGGNFDEAERLLAQRQISPAEFHAAQRDAFAWVSQFKQE